MKRLSLDLRAEFPQAEGFPCRELVLYQALVCFLFSNKDFFYQAGKKLQEVENSATPMPEILLGVPWRHQTVIVSKCDTIQTASVLSQEGCC